MRRRHPVAACTGLIALVTACGDDVGGSEQVAVPTAEATVATTAPIETPTATSATTSSTVTAVTDPSSTFVTHGGLLCTDEWYSGTVDFEPGAVGVDTIDEAIDEWWRSEGAGLGWDRDALEPTLDRDGRTTRYSTATGRPVLLLVAEQLGGGWGIGSVEGCSER